MTLPTDQAPGEVARTPLRPTMLGLAVVLCIAWAYYLFVANLHLRLDAALATVPAAFATVLKSITLLAVFMIPALLVFLLLSRIGAVLDAPPPSPEQMLEAVREGHRQALAKARELIEGQLATLSDAEAAELRPHLEEGLRRSTEQAALREQRYAADPSLMQRELRETLAAARAQQRLG